MNDNSFAHDKINELAVKYRTASPPERKSIKCLFKI